MKDKSTFRLLTLGFLSGVIVSGLIFLMVHSFQSKALQKLRIDITPTILTQNDQSKQVQSDNKLDLNKATLAQLVALPGIGETKANAIIEFRQKYGNYEDISELSYVTGIGNTLLKSIQDLVIIN